MAHVGSVSMNRDLTFSERKGRRESLRRTGNAIFMRKGEEWFSVRKKTKVICNVHHGSNSIHKHYFGRTSVELEPRRSSWKRVVSNLNVKNIRHWGRFRAEIRVEGKRDLSKNSNTTESKFRDDGECMEVNHIWHDIPGGNAAAKGTRKRARNLRGNYRMRKDGSGAKRRRVRRMIRLEDYVLFNVGVRENDMDGSSIGERNAHCRTGLNEREKFEKSLKECLLCFRKLHIGWDQVPFMRCSGGSRRNQKYICVSTLRIMKKLFCGDEVMFFCVSILVEEESRKFRTMTIRNEVNISRHGKGGSERQNVICSCSMEWNADGNIDSTCWHVQVLKKDTELMDTVNDVITSAFNEEGSELYFGELLTVKECDENGSIVLCDENETNIEEREIREGQVAVQVDDRSNEDIVGKGNSVAKKWALWSVLDLNDGMYVHVVCRAVSIGVNKIRMNCTSCRHDVSQKCRHEVACDRENDLDGRLLTGNDEEESDDEYDGDVVEAMDIDSEGNGDDGNDDGNGNVDDCNMVRSVENAPSGDGERADRTVVNERDQGAYRNRAGPSDTKEIFFPPKVKRSFMLCDVENKLAAQLAELIEGEAAEDGSLVFNDVVGTACRGEVEGIDGSRRRCEGTRKVTVEGEVPRKMTLFTLNHGDIGIVVLDWICSECKHLNRYIGLHHGIFPCTYGVAYTVELLYWWIHEIAGTTNSFISVYSSSRKLQGTPTYEQRFLRGRLNVRMGSHKPNRSLANDAIRAIIQDIDVDSDMMSKQLFSCPKCEVPLTDSDFTQLGLDKAVHSGKKRLSSVVIDAKVVALLKDGEKCCDEHHVLNAVPGLKTRIASNRNAQNAIKMALKLFRACIAKARVELDTCDINHDDFFVEEGVLHVRLCAMKRYGGTKTQKSRVKIVEYIRIIRSFLDPTACLYEGPRRSTEPNHQGCSESRRKIRGAAGWAQAHNVLSTMFQNSSGRNIESAVQPGVNGSENSGTDSDEGSDNADVGDHGGNGRKEHIDAWVSFPFGDYFESGDQMSAALEAISFCLVEPISLGFFPYEPDFVDIAAAQHLNGPVLEAGSSAHDVCRSVQLLGKETIQMHRAAACALRVVASCKHDSRKECNWICSLCSTALSDARKRMTTQNPVIGKYMTELLRNGKRSPLFSRRLAGILACALEQRISAFKQYLADLGNGMKQSTVQYWETFGRPYLPVLAPTVRTSGVVDRRDDKDDIASGGKQSLYVFPGRCRRRHGIDFEKNDKQECTKNYFKGISAIPSFMTVQCCCAHPKLLGFVVLKESESISAALSSVMTHFSIPPRTVWYDNACNSYDSAIMRVPWLLRWTRLLVDRFHFTVHVCSNSFNGNLHAVLDDDRSTAAEVINAIITKGTNHIKYLEGRNVIPFMKAMFAHMNAVALVNDRLHRRDLEDDDVKRLFRSTFKCTCHLCDRDVMDSAVTNWEPGSWTQGIAIFTRNNQYEQLSGMDQQREH